MDKVIAKVYEYPGYKDNEGNLHAVDPVTLSVRRAGRTIKLTEKQQLRLKEAIQNIVRGSNTISIMFDCDGEFFRVGKLTKEDHDKEMGISKKREDDRGR